MKRTTLSNTENLKLTFWQAFNSNATSNAIFIKSFKLRKPQAQHWYDLGVGSSSYHVDLTVNTQKNCLTAGIYIDDDKDLYQKFVNNEASLKKILGDEEIEWRDAKKASRFYVSTPFDINDSDNWAVAFNWFYDKCLKIKKAVKEIDK
jgi:hypothetical protein